MLKKFLSGLLIVLFASIGGYLGFLFLDMNLIEIPESIENFKIGLVIFGIALGALLGVFSSNGIIDFFKKFAKYVDQQLTKAHASDVVMGALGLILGLIIANLLGTILSQMGVIGKVVWLVSTALLGYLGLVAGVKKREELLNWLAGVLRFMKEKSLKATADSEVRSVKILDTSAIIDGRVVELCESGFLEGTLVVPSFVVNELRYIADSSDILKRNRGRRGLDILNHMRKNIFGIKVQIYDDVKDLSDVHEVDEKLVKLAKKLNAKILTNDYNLNKVAELQGVKVLNINELANAVKPVVLPGEEMKVSIVKDGKESGQGLAYLEDGTMIVVEGGKKYIGKTIDVLVTSALQTAAGRMIFAKIKSKDYKKSSNYNSGANIIG
ncbi:TRAM domain-containing protein [Peptococcaceae bacterium]|nr:TRAM domain-containing protein [Peptococcaceae bacterium]